MLAFKVVASVASIVATPLTDLEYQSIVTCTPQLIVRSHNLVPNS